MSFFNRVIIEGNIGKDFEIRETSTGTPWVCFPIAVNEEWYDSSGQQQSKTLWFMVKSYGKTAVNAHKFLGKGCSILVEGKLAVEDWQNREGDEWEQVLVIASSIRYLDTKNTLERKKKRAKVYNKFQEGDEEWFEDNLDSQESDYDLNL